jgi:hypothetical protein
MITFPLGDQHRSWQDRFEGYWLREGSRPLGFVHVYKYKTAANARRFLRDLERNCPFPYNTSQCPAGQWMRMRIRTILTGRAIPGAIGLNPMASDQKFTDWVFGLRKRSQSRKHEFDNLNTGLDINPA